MSLSTCIAILTLALTIHAQAQIEKVSPEPSTLVPIAVQAIGRTQLSADGTYTYQWPGVYFVADFNGTAFFFRAGAGKQHLRVHLDGQTYEAELDASPAAYRINAEGPGKHHLRMDVINENQDGWKSIGAFATRRSGTRHLIVDGPPPRQIEFIGDSHTVGYGNTSASTTCTQDEVWSTTDTTQSPGALVAAHFHADYQLNAISGRGVVRNYNGIAGDTVPEAYPFVFLRKEAHSRDASRYSNKDWDPSVLVISLGTNDFSTDLHAGEPWHTRDNLHAAYENTYKAFIRSLRRAHPHALILLWATDMAHGEIAAESRRVADTLRAAGDTRVHFLEVPNLTFNACHGHPTTADDQTIANALVAAIELNRAGWH